ncbi:MAG TPA: SAM-dependent methyltransferase [Bacteroidales bacterium]|nr:SAM-dependent methyltransferase [Bacteroidales bacterium]
MSTLHSFANTTLYLIPVPLATGNPLYHLPPVTIEIIGQLNDFIVENKRSAVRFLTQLRQPHEINSIRFYTYNEHSMDYEFSQCMEPLNHGRNTGLISEAGAPCIADPGSKLVAAAHSKGIRVMPLTGPSSIFLALMASGFNGQCFTFKGYIPVNRQERVQCIRKMESEATNKQETQIFIETPYRNKSLLDTLTSACRPYTMLCIAIDIGSRDEQIITRTIQQWKTEPVDINKRLAVFLLGQ